jgi:hypothetical protein
MYQNADMKTKIYLTLDKIPDIMKRADDPLIENRDTRDLMFLLSRMKSVNSRLRGHVTTRKMGYASFDWEITSDDEKLIQRMKPFIKAIMNEYINATMFGVMGFKCLWVQGDLGWQLSKYKKYKPIELDFEPAGVADDADDILLLINQDDNKKTPIESNNLDYFYYVEPEFERGGLLRSVIIPELLRYETQTEWKNLNKRMKGIVLASIDADKLANAQDKLDMSEAQVNKSMTDLDAAMAAVGTHNYLRSLNYANVELKSLVEGTAGSSFQAFKKELDADIAIAVLGQANTSELPTGGGSRAALQVLNLIRQDILLNDMLNITELANRALLVDFQKNMDANAVSTEYEFKWKYDENADIEAYARVFETVSRSTTPIIIGKKEYYNKLGLTVPAEGDETISMGGQQAGVGI